MTAANLGGNPGKNGRDLGEKLCSFELVLRQQQHFLRGGGAGCSSSSRLSMLIMVVKLFLLGSSNGARFTARVQLVVGC